MEKIIFDLDNTLLMYDKNYLNDYNIIIKKYGYNLKPGALYESIGRYEDLKVKYNKNDMIDFINNDLNINMKAEIFEELLNIIGEWVSPLEDGLIDTLEYLNSKYKLYVLTNWYTECYTKRLNKAGILKYFKEVVGADKVIPKPNSDGYMYIANNTPVNQCLMIGDRLDIDILGAISIGMNALLFDYDNEYNGKCDKILKISKLKEML